MKKGSGSAISRLLSPSSSLPHGAPQLESLRLFLRRAQRRYAALSADAFPPFLAACRSFPSLARQAHALALKSAADLHPATATALLDFYGRRGLLRDALRVFDGMPLRDPIAWNALFSCFLRQGLAADALSTFRRMTEDGVAFTGVTLSASLKACASLRAVRLGKQIHARAIREGDDSLITSTSLIDFYSACGLIQNAFHVFAGVDCDKDAAIHNSKKLTSAVYVAMLNACRANMDLARVDQVAEHLLELGDSNPASYILLSNFYAAAGKWERAESLRMAMRNRQLKKEVGNSQFV